MSIVIENLCHVYGKGTPFLVEALKDVSLEIEKGQLTGIIGHTGSGKSTLAQHLNGLERATSGHIFYNGTDIYSDGYFYVIDSRKVFSEVSKCKSLTSAKRSAAMYLAKYDRGLLCSGN